MSSSAFTISIFSLRDAISALFFNEACANIKQRITILIVRYIKKILDFLMRLIETLDDLVGDVIEFQEGLTFMVFHKPLCIGFFF